MSENSKTNFFSIHSVVIIGASETPGKIGNTMLQNLEHFDGEVSGVNPKYSSPKQYQALTPSFRRTEEQERYIYPTIASLSTIPDLAVICIPEKLVLQSMQELGEKGIKRVIIISAGFKEVGNTEAEIQLQEIAKQYDIALLWPNCLGYYDVCRNLDVSFWGKEAVCGNVAMVSQSGAMAVALFDWAKMKRLGVCKMISMGNKAGVDENDLLRELEHDKKTEVIAMYLESIEDGRTFFELAKKISKKKPIVLIKSGISDKWSLAASSHTGALSAKKEILETAFIGAGIHFTHSVEDFFLWSHMFAMVRDTEAGDELVIITNAGWPGVMATDHVEFQGVTMAQFSDTEKTLLHRGLPDAASVKNPIDIIGDATSTTYKQVLQNLASLEKKRAILLILTAQSVTDVEEIARVIVAFQRQNQEMLVMVSFMWGSAVLGGREILQSGNILEYDYPKKAIIAYKELLMQRKWEQVPEVSVKLPFLKTDVQQNLSYKLAKEEKLVSDSVVSALLSAYEIPHTTASLVTDVSQIINVFHRGAKYVAKIASPDIAHKTDCGGVVLGIYSLSWAEEAYTTIRENVKKIHPNAQIDGVLFQTMAWAGKEIFVGCKRDASFWEVLIVGLGGIYVNIYEDVTRRIGPVSKDEIWKMFQELRGYSILAGVRGESSIDFEKLAETIFKMQTLFHEFPQIQEIDINPIIATEHDVLVVDVKMYL